MVGEGVFGPCPHRSFFIKPIEKRRSVRNVNLFTMKYELQALENLVNDVTAGLSTPEILKLILAEEERLPKAITENIFLLNSDYLVRQYICWHLDGLVKLADKIYWKTHGATGQEPKKTLVVVLNLLDTLGRSFPEYLDNNIPLPRVVLDRERKVYTDELTTLKQVLVKNKINPKLVEITLIPLENFVSKRHHRLVTCSGYHYLKQYVRALKGLDFKRTEYKVPDYVLTDKLITVNYNSSRMLDYCTDVIGSYLKKYATPAEKEKVLVTLKKILNQLTIISGVRYDHRFPAIREELTKWADEEMTFLANPAQRAGNAAKQFQKLRLPVEQIAYLAFLLNKHNVFIGIDRNGVIRHYVNTYASKETEQISEGSFRNHFKQPTDRAARGLRTLLRKILADIDEFLK